jgi:3-phenylpropionate/trans-cinnamate dioxygenase ferredoxin subunit
MIPVCPLTELPPGENRRLALVPPVTVFHTEDGELFAIDDTCTHQDASLADGWLEGCEVECPLHSSKFDLRTGAADGLPARLPVRTHQVVVAEGTIHVVLSSEPPNLPAAPNLPPGATRSAIL